MSMFEILIIGLLVPKVEVEKMRRTERLYSGRQSPSAERCVSNIVAVCVHTWSCVFL